MTRKLDGFPSVNSPSLKRRREEPNVEAPSKNFVGRKLLSGTSSDGNHGLGVPVVFGPRSDRPERVSPFAKLKKKRFTSLVFRLTSQLINLPNT